MLYAKFGLFALLLFGGVWWMARMMTSVKRNDGATHGGGLDDMNRDAWAGHDSKDVTGDV
jgi:hypothetical protein